MTARDRIVKRLAALLMSAGVVGGMTACTSPSPAELIDRHKWHVTVYYTAVESFHGDAAVPVEGCASRDCANGHDPLGSYPHSFVTAVREEGAGRITEGPNAGKYLNWSHNIGYWLDTAARDAHGRPLEPLRSAAADDLPDGTELRLTDCGRLDSGEPVPDHVCGALRTPQWQILDRFTPGYGGPMHIDLYIGEENHDDFTTSGALYVSLANATFVAED